MSSVADLTRVLIIKHTPSKVVGWIGGAFFIFCGVMSWRAGARGASLLFFGFVALSGYLILSSGSMHINSDSIKYYLPLRSYKIRWNEVQYIEIDRQGSNIVFCGENKRLAMLGPAFWCGKDRIDTFRLVAAQIDKYDIEVRQTEKAMFRLSRNTRVDKRLN